MKPYLALSGTGVESSDQLVRVLIADPKLTSWEGLLEALPSTGGYVVFVRAGTLDQILAEADRMAPCVVLVSYDQVCQAANDDLHERLRGVGDVRVLVRGAASRAAAEQLLARGVRGLLPDDVDGPVLRKAVRSVDRGEVWAGRLLVSRLLQKLQSRLTARELSDREFEILDLITKGFSNREIAERLFICRETVRWHIRSLYSKIGAKDRTDAARHGREFVLIESRPPKSDAASTSSVGQVRGTNERMAAD